MSSNPASIATSSKAPVPSSQPSPAQSQPGSSASGDSFGQRRSGGLGSFGAGATSRASPAPRNSQQARKQHKNSRRPRQSDEDAIAESLAMRPFNSRKGQTSITHLMNFSLPPRPQHNHNGPRNYRRNPTWGLGSGYHAMDKARYVHANYRFIVDPRGDYRAQSVDADVYLDWNNVLQILASSQSQEASCPICLGTPVAPRMARCGHIFCLPCLIRYMHSEEEGKPGAPGAKVPEKRPVSRHCPICWDSIRLADTRPVRWYLGEEGEPPREGGDVVLRLVMRAAGSTLALPRDGADMVAEGEEIPWNNAAEVMDYARIMRGGEDYMSQQFDAEIEELQSQAKEDELMFGEDNAEWVRKAVRAIREVKEKVKGIGNPPKMLKPADPKPKRAPITFSEDNTDVPNMYQIQIASKSGQSIPSVSHAGTPATNDGGTNPGTTTAPARTTSTPPASQQSHANALESSLAELRNRQRHETSHTPTEYYFYQALLHYYLSPLDIRILKAAFGNFSSFPATILPRVERVSTGHVVDDELRKRTKYLAHLPYGCEVNFLECDWTDTVSPEILERFKPEIEKRRKRNHDKEVREEKARLKAEREDHAQFLSTRRKRPSISDQFSADDFQPLASGSGVEGSYADVESTSTSPPWPARRGEGFASLASPSTSPSAPRTVWGTAAIAPQSPLLNAAPADLGVQDDGWLQGWEKELLQEDEMIAQAQALSLGDGGVDASASTLVSNKPAGGKGKKKKKITLMSTNVRRGA